MKGIQLPNGIDYREELTTWDRKKNLIACALLVTWIIDDDCHDDYSSSHLRTALLLSSIRII